MSETDTSVELDRCGGSEADAIALEDVDDVREPSVTGSPSAPPHTARLDVPSSPPVSRVRIAFRWLRMQFSRLLSLRNLAGLAIAVIFAGSLWVIVNDLQSFEYAKVGAYLLDLPALYVGIAILITATNFVVLSGYDALAFQYVHAKLSPRRIAFSAFIGYAVSQAVGNPILTGGSVRYRLYSSWGLSGETITKAIIFSGTSFWLGFFTLGSIVFLAQPIPFPDALGLPVRPTLAGVACLLPTLGYFGFTALRDDPVQVQGWTLDIPPRWMIPAQVGLAAADLVLATSVLYVLLPPTAAISFPMLLSVYLVALLAGLISHVPGGLGVFDGIVVLMLAPLLPAETVLGALLAYRGIFHLLPLILALIGFGVYEARRGLAG